MNRTLALFLHYFRWQRTMVWGSGIGLVLIALFVFLPQRFQAPAFIAGAGLLAGFPLTFAGIAFRELISNRRFAIVPRLRFHAAIALLLLALLGTLLVYAAVLLINADPANDGQIDPRSTAVLAFSLISGYVLITQCIAVHAAGLFGFVLLPLIVLRLSLNDTPLFERIVEAPPLAAAVAGAGWIWLLLVTWQAQTHAAVASPRWGSGYSEDPLGARPWYPDFGLPKTAAGTLMRGVRDNLQNRFFGVFLALVTLPIMMLGVVWLLGVPLSGGGRTLSTTAAFLMWSLFGAASYASFQFREWPARLRLIWLRRGGDRAAAWRMLDEALLGDVLLSALIAAVIAVVAYSFGGGNGQFYALYAISCTVLCALSSYFSFVSRTRGWPALADVLFSVSLIFVLVFTIVAVRSDAALSPLYWTLTFLAALAVATRSLARRAVLKIDWCAVRPSMRRRTN